MTAFVLTVGLAFAGSACRQAAAPGGESAATTNAANSAAAAANSPTEAYKMLFAAVRAKDAATIKGLMSKSTVSLAESAAQRFGKTLDKQLENGFLQTTMTETLPEIRDERVTDNFGTVEVYNRKTGNWDETFFIREDGGWKLANGDKMAGKFQSPGASRTPINTGAPDSADGGVKSAEVPRAKPNGAGRGGEKQ